MVKISTLLVIMAIVFIMISGEGGKDNLGREKKMGGGETCLLFHFNYNRL